VIKNISEMDPKVQYKFTHFTEIIRELKIPFQIIETLRPQEVQDAYYAQGRKPVNIVNALRDKVGLYLITEDENTIITQAKISKHTSGLAMDAAPFWPWYSIDWNVSTLAASAPWHVLGNIARECGISWGGDWTPKNSVGIGWDAPHFEVV